MPELDQKQILTEIMGTFVSQNPNPVAPNPLQPPEAYQRPRKADPRVSGFTLSHCATLEAWQRTIINNLSIDNRDQYIIARPGGGKTLPIICHWTNNILGLNTMASTMTGDYRGAINSIFNTNRRNVPKLLIMVPVIVLAQQTAMEIRKYLADILIQAFNNIPNTEIFTYLRKGPQGHRIDALANQLESLQAEVDHIDNLSNFDAQYSNKTRAHESLNALNKSIKTEIENRIHDLVNGMIYLRTGNTISKDLPPIDQALVFVSIYESTPNFIDDITNLRLTIIDEAHLIQESGIENDDNTRSYQIMGKLFEVLKSKALKQDNNRLVMLSGTINPISAGNVTNYLNKCFNRNFTEPVSAPIEASNRSELSIIVNERIATDKGITDSIIKSVQQRDWGQLYVIFSAERIKNIIENCIDKLGVRDIQNAQPNNYAPENVFNNLGQRRQNSQNYKLDTNSSDRLGIPRGMEAQVANITNPLLRQSVLRGIGFIYRNIKGNVLAGRDSLLMNDTDKIIVAKLFRERKLNVLLATDSVGIGVNIDVKDLYIPEVTKFSGEIQNQMTLALRDLAQILNRAGRGATPIAAIQTPKKNIEIVTNALYSNPEDLPEVDEIRGNIIPCSLKTFINAMGNRGQGININVQQNNPRFGAHVNFKNVYPRALGSGRKYLP